MTSPKITNEVQKLYTSPLIDLFVLDLTPIGVLDVFRFHSMNTNGNTSIWWQGEEYLPFPLEAEGFEKSGNGQLPRPTIRVANVVGLISTLVQQMDDLVGAKVIRKRTFSKFLDPANFGGTNPDADDAAMFEDEVWFVDRKSHESKNVVEFELAVPWDLEGVSVPMRPCGAVVCAWEYRGDGCGYTGPAVAKIDDTPTTDLAQDNCSKRLSGCRLRPWVDGELPFGAFPAVGIIR